MVLFQCILLTQKTGSIPNLSSHDDAAIYRVGYTPSHMLAAPSVLALNQLDTEIGMTPGNTYSPLYCK